SSRSLGVAKIVGLRAGAGASLAGVIVLLLRHEVSEIRVEALITGVPELAIVLGPFGDLFDRRRLQAPRPPLRLAATRDQARSLEHPKVLRDRGPAHRERLGELAHRALAGGETRENSAPRG